MRARRARSVRRSNPLRKRLDFPMVSPKHLADQIEGGCIVGLREVTSRRWELEINVQFKISIYDHRDDPQVWEVLKRKLWIGFDGTFAGFPILQVHATESTFTLRCRYPGRGSIDRIRKELKLRLAPSEDPRTGVLLEVREIRPTVLAKSRLPKSRQG